MAKRGRRRTTNLLNSADYRQAAADHALEHYHHGGLTINGIRAAVRAKIAPPTVQQGNVERIAADYQRGVLPTLGSRICYAVEVIQRTSKVDSAAAVCRLCGVNPTWLNKLMISPEPGRKDHRRQAILEKISKTTKIPVEWLMCGTGDLPAEIQRLVSLKP